MEESCLFPLCNSFINSDTSSADTKEVRKWENSIWLQIPQRWVQWGENTRGQTSSTHSSTQLRTYQPLEAMIDWTALQQLGWKFMQEVANKFNCFSLRTQKKKKKKKLMINYSASPFCRPHGESNICHLFKAHQLTGNQVTNTLWFHVSIWMS